MEELKQEANWVDDKSEFELKIIIINLTYKFKTDLDSNCIRRISGLIFKIKSDLDSNLKLNRIQDSDLIIIQS
jgi:hypothetical protein